MAGRVLYSSREFTCFLTLKLLNKIHIFSGVNAPFPQRPLHLNLAQTASGHFSFTKPLIQQHPQHPYPRPYPMVSHPDGRPRFPNDEQWRLPSSEYADGQHGAWMSGRNPSHAGPSFGQEGYFRPPPPNNMGFQVMVFHRCCHVDQTCLPLTAGGQLNN
ncbi:hypothetical protein NC653_012451 [Populus alba x Populus x berolinensis]|uniref:Uncharacterized protein n=1 Tax=Populus alba x Populus x berolinensis TaxID=444605 RepID=A0AAD6W1F1_9ROSI|nr:hypothetical protein NC653_012451 [Populus alba x Populus x berolinensis]